MTTPHDIRGMLARRELLRIGAFAGIGAALMPRLALAASDPAMFAKTTQIVERWVGPGKCPGLVAAIGMRDQEPRFVVRGTDSFVDLDRLTPDSLFRIYSMTKPVTAIAAMILIDDGKLRLDQPVADLLPKYAKMQVLGAPNGPLSDVRPAKAQMTIRHLMTHTAGLGYPIIQTGPLREAMEARGIVSGRVSHTPFPGFDRGVPAPNLAAFADRLAEMPLVAEPGTAWIYSLGLDLLGRVIEVASGKSFESFLQERMFDPLDMRSTWFHVPRSDAKRLTTNFAVMGGTFLPIDKGEDSVYLKPPAYPFGGSGLVSTPRDYDRFLWMLANFGKLGNRRILREETVRLATSNLLPPGVSMQGTMVGGGGFGAGGRIGFGPETGSFGWGGAAATSGLVDMTRGARYGIFAQFMPPTAVPVIADLGAAMREDVMALLKVSA